MIQSQAIPPALIEFTQRIALCRQIGLQDIQYLTGGVGVCGYLADQCLQMFHFVLLFLQVVPGLCGIHQSSALIFETGLKRRDILPGSG